MAGLFMRAIIAASPTARIRELPDGDRSFASLMGTAASDPPETDKDCRIRKPPGKFARGLGA